MPRAASLPHSSSWSIPGGPSLSSSRPLPGSRMTPSGPRLRSPRSRAALAAFVGEGPIVGQNVGFDLAYLERAGAEPHATRVRHGQALASGDARTHLSGPERTRCGPGDRDSHGASCPPPTRARPPRSSSSCAGAQPRSRAISGCSSLASSRSSSRHSPARSPATSWRWTRSSSPQRSRSAGNRPRRWSGAEVPEPVARGDVASAFAAAARVVARFEDRPQQLEMSEAVADAFSEGGQWLIEAGTGVGKSLAYLVPAALYALRNGTRVVVSTNTITLQEQLLGKDVPALREILLEAGAIGDPEDLRVATLKGRANYLCLQRWVGGHQANLGDPDVARLAAALALWLPRTPSGDRGELNLEPGARAAWARFSAAEVDCLSRQHTFVRDGRCFLHRARKTAESAHIVIVNHALLLADIATGRSAIPPVRSPHRGRSAQPRGPGDAAVRPSRRAPSGDGSPGRNLPPSIAGPARGRDCDGRRGLPGRGCSRQRRRP